jgi:DNA topoisomerase III
VDHGGKNQANESTRKSTTGKKNEVVKSENETRSKNTKKNNTQSFSQQSSPTVPANQPQQTSDINYGKGETIHIVHIAEKPSIAQAIAKGLAEGQVNTYSKALPVTEFTGPAFPKAPYAANCKHKVTSVAGHVFSVDFPSQYQSWDSVDPAELFTAPIQRKADKGPVVKHLQESGRNADFIVLWMDCDREGENINFEVLECCMNLMKSAGGSNFDRVYRAYFSAINPSDIKKAYNALGKPDKNQAMSVDARQELDLKVGVAFSRFQTKFFQGRYGDLESGVLSYGPCQTPTLGFCVQRHIDIETFKPEKFWVLDLGIMKRGRAVRALWNSGRSFDRAKVQKLQEEAFMNSAVVEVKNITTKQTKQVRPIPLNTVALLKACSKALSLGPHAAMQTAERLYLMGYLSYPRTESTTYPKSFDIRGTLQQQASDSRWGTFARTLVQEGHKSSRGGVDMGDHPPITPCRAARPGELSGDMDRVFDLVVRHFIASVSPDAIFQSTRVDFGIDALGEKGTFTLRGKTLVSPGFLAVLLHKQYGDAPPEDGEEEEEERTIPEFEIGEVMTLANSTNTTSGKVNTISNVAVRATLDIKEGVTSPPGYLTESELIGLMEKHGIGTDASIPTHIENIQKRNYVALGSGRRLLPQKLGLVLVQGYHLIDSSLVLPQVRSDIEDQCSKIAKGLATKEAVVTKAIALFSAKYDYFIKNIDKMDLLFGASFSKLEDIGKPFTRCGLSRRYLQFIPGPPPRLYNKWTETVYPLPIGGVVKQWSGRECPVDGCHFELCLYLVGQPERTFPFCPRCYNDIEWALETDETLQGVEQEDIPDKVKERQIQRVAGKAIVLECPLPDHHPVVEELTVSPDPEGDGVLIVDPHFGPKWRLNATRDPTIHYLPRLSIDKLTILNKKDETHDTRLMQIIFKTDKTPLPSGETKLVTNFIDDTVLRGMVVVHHGKERSKPTFRGGRGRGGRGGRGRGRGRGGRGGGSGR